jgi:hypothetical protein
MTRNGSSLLQEIVGSNDLAELLVVSPRHVRRLTQTGVLPQAKDKEGKILRGRYVLGVVIPRAFEYTRESLVSDDSDQKRYRAARAAKEEATAELAQFELEVKRGFYHHAADVEFAVTTFDTACKARLLAIPARVARLLVGMTDFKAINDLIYGEIVLALRELTGYVRAHFSREVDKYIESLDDSGGHHDPGVKRPRASQI